MVSGNVVLYIPNNSNLKLADSNLIFVSLYDIYDILQMHKVHKFLGPNLFISFTMDLTSVNKMQSIGMHNKVSIICITELGNGSVVLSAADNKTKHLYYYSLLSTLTQLKTVLYNTVIFTFYDKLNMFRV